MFAAMLYFLAAAGFFEATAVCLWMVRLLRPDDGASMGDVRPMWARKTNWDEVKASFLVWYARCQEREATNRKTVLSWARTCALCTTLCMIGICLEVEFDESISVSHLIAGLIRTPVATANSESPPPGHSLPE